MSDKHFLSFDVGTVNLGVAAATVSKDGEAVLEWLDTADISASCADRCVTRLWTYLDELMAILGWQRYVIFIERQPRSVCSLMRTVELGIRHFFLMRGHRNADESPTVKSVSPKRKLAAPVIYAAGASSSQKYKARKNAGLAEAIATFSELPDVVKFLETGKADDAADASLYLVHFGGARRFVSVSEHALKNGRARADAKEAAAAAKTAERQAKVQAAEDAKTAARAAKAAERQVRLQAAEEAKAAAKAAKARERQAAKDAKQTAMSLDSPVSGEEENKAVVDM
jgi:hypothetical protein